jgi:hypothetical protein
MAIFTKDSSKMINQTVRAYISLKINPFMKASSKMGSSMAEEN